MSAPRMTESMWFDLLPFDWGRSARDMWDHMTAQERAVIVACARAEAESNRRHNAASKVADRVRRRVERRQVQS